MHASITIYSHNVHKISKFAKFVFMFRFHLFYILLIIQKHEKNYSCSYLHANTIRVSSYFYFGHHAKSTGFSPKITEQIFYYWSSKLRETWYECPFIYLAYQMVKNIHASLTCHTWLSEVASLCSKYWYIYI